MSEPETSSGAGSEAFDRVLAEFSDLQDRLIALPSDAFAERYELRARQSELRSRIAEMRGDVDAGRPTDDLLAELAGLRERLAAIEHRRIDMVSYVGGSGGGAMAMSPDEGLNRRMDAAAGLGDVQSRIGRIKGILIDRGVDVPEAQ